MLTNQMRAPKKILWVNSIEVQLQCAFDLRDYTFHWPVSSIRFYDEEAKTGSQSTLVSSFGYKFHEI